MSDLTPITREEALLDGQNLEPITRKEMFIKRIYDDTQEIPEPATREEWFLKKAGEGSSPVTVEALSVTANGTYSEAGKAYSPVTVEVPLPTNANERKSVTSYPVTDSANYPLPKCDVTVTDADKCEVIVTTDNVVTEDSGVYIERQSGGGNRELDEIVGGSVVWNQLVKETDTSCTVQSGHKYVLKQGSTYTVVVSDGTAFTVDGSVNDNVYDLTALFGTTIADYIYSLETANAGAGVAWFRRYFPKDYYAYCEPHFEHTQVQAHETVGFNQWDEQWELGSIDSSTGEPSSSTTSIRSKNYTSILPNTSYYVAGLSSGILRQAFYDADKHFIGCGYWQGGTSNNPQTTPSNARYMKFWLTSAYGTTYKNDICINISNPSKNGTYEPYEGHTYPINPITLRGIPKLNASNQLYYDGDRYEASGRVTRKYGIRAYQSGDESLADAITDGTNTVYKLTTPTYEDSSPFEANQIVDANGTEAYIDAGVEAGSRDVAIPVGHETKYFNGKAYVKPLTTGTSGTVSMADMGIMPTSPMYIEANGTLDVEYWKSNS